MRTERLGRSGLAASLPRCATGHRTSTATAAWSTPKALSPHSAPPATQASTFLRHRADLWVRDLGARVRDGAGERAALRPRSAFPGRSWLGGSRSRAAGPPRRPTGRRGGLHQRPPPRRGGCGSRSRRTRARRRPRTTASWKRRRPRRRPGARQPDLARQRVHAGVGGGGEGFVAVVAELGHQLRADEAAATDDDEFHDEPFLCAVGRETGLCAVGRAPGPRAAVTDRRRSRGSRRIALGWASSPVVHRTLCWPCSSVASAQRASRL